MNQNLQDEIAYRLTIGCERLTVQEMAARFLALGYKLDRSKDCRSNSRYLTGPRAGMTHPTITTGLREADTGLSAFNFEARRDDNFRAMQKLRQHVFAVTRGAMLEV